MPDTIRLNLQIKCAKYKNAKYNIHVIKNSFSIIKKIMNKILTGEQTQKLKEYFLQKYCIYGKKQIKNLKYEKSIIIFVNALEILGMNKFCQTIKEHLKDHNLIIACDNFDAYEISKKLDIGGLVIYTPWDMGFLGRRMINQFNPKIIIFAVKIFHPVLINEFARNGIFSCLISGIFSHEIANDPVFKSNFKRLLANKTMEKLNCISMINEDCKSDLLHYIKLNDIYVAGNIRDDVSHAHTSDEEKKNFYSKMKLKNSDKIIIAAATRDDEELIIDAYKLILKKIPEAKLIIVPRHIEKVQKIIKLIEDKELKYVKLSQIQDKSEQIIVVDILIELSKLYSIANVIIFTRTFLPIGGNANILEPAYHGKPIIFGKFLKLSRSHITHILREHPQIEAENSEQIAQSVVYFLKNKKIAKEAGGKFKEITYRGEEIAVNNAKIIIKELNKYQNDRQNAHMQYMQQ